MSSLGEEAVLVGLPGDGVGDALPLVAVAAAPDEVSRLRLIPRIRFTRFSRLDIVGGFVPGK